MSERFCVVEEVERLRAEVKDWEKDVEILKKAINDSADAYFKGKARMEKEIKTLNTQIKELKSVLTEIVAISDRKHDAWDKAKMLMRGHDET